MIFLYQVERPKETRVLFLCLKILKGERHGRKQRSNNKW